MARFDVEAALALLERLPPRMAQVVRLRAEGFSANEIGAIVGLKANAVRVTQHRAPTRLRRLVADSADHRERFADQPMARVTVRVAA